MKIIEGTDDILQLWLSLHDDEILVSINNKEAIVLTPLEALTVRDILTRLINRTAYFREINNE